MSTNRLTRSKSNTVIAGVCAGLARYFGWDAGRVRLVYLLLSIISIGFPGTLVYIILWIIMPAD
jgi:phage shock protein C